MVDWVPEGMTALPIDLNLGSSTPPIVNPPIEPHPDKPPYHALPPEWFERLCVDLAQSIERVSFRLYGRPGQAQAGIDLYGRRSNGTYVAWQAKRQASLTAAQLEAAFVSFFAKPHPFTVSRFVVAAPVDDRDSNALRTLEHFRELHPTVEVEFYGIEILTAALRERPELVLRYFGVGLADAPLRRFTEHKSRPVELPNDHRAGGNRTAVSRHRAWHDSPPTRGCLHSAACSGRYPDRSAESPKLRFHR